ncbi:Zinc finger protein [Plakobranchus ocellatus]|uniref:Zinc finger protein n=1 Tax=Plakobranchus ocellatus TaxID=259542 RepID=A0AAV3Z9X2_9GAST|nr:Zinc finger protein [Plakobranchus ocellatus]
METPSHSMNRTETQFTAQEAHSPWHVNSGLLKKPSCPVCDKKFSRSYDVKRHLRCVHGSSQCPNCGLILKADDPVSLRQHEQSFLPSSNNSYDLQLFQGTQSSSSYPSEESHLSQREVACPHCSLLIPECFLKSHLSKQHGSSMPYWCKVCGRGYLSNTGLYYHMATHNGKAVNCPVCGKTFARKFTLNRHMMYAHYHTLQHS